MPASVSAGDLLLVALKMPPSRIGTYSNFTPVRCSIAGIASWLRKALGLPKSNMNCGFRLTMISPKWFLYDCYHSNQPSGAPARDQPRLISGFVLKSRLREPCCVVAHVRGPFGGQLFETDRIIGE